MGMAQLAFAFAYADGQLFASNADRADAHLPVAQVLRHSSMVSSSQMSAEPKLQPYRVCSAQKMYPQNRIMHAHQARLSPRHAHGHVTPRDGFHKASEEHIPHQLPSDDSCNSVSATRTLEIRDMEH